MRIKISALLLAPALLAAVAIPSPLALAQTATIQVPFSFQVSKQICPAGTYQVQKNAIGRQVKFSSLDARHSFVWNAIPSDPAANGPVVLTFRDSGATHALDAVQIDNALATRLAKPAAQDHGERLAIAGE